MINKTFPITEKLIINGLSLSKKLLDLLTRETESLKSRTDARTISEIATNKKEIVSQLDQFSKQLSQVLLTEKLQLASNGMVDYFKIAKSADFNTVSSNKMWAEILTLSKQCRMLNEKNGASINILAQHTQRSLQILKGKSQQATTYGPDGSTHNTRFSTPLFSV